MSLPTATPLYVSYHRLSQTHSCVGVRIHHTAWPPAAWGSSHLGSWIVSRDWKVRDVLGDKPPRSWSTPAASQAQRVAPWTSLDGQVITRPMTHRSLSLHCACWLVRSSPPCCPFGQGPVSSLTFRLYPDLHEEESKGLGSGAQGSPRLACVTTMPTLTCVQVSDEIASPNALEQTGAVNGYLHFWMMSPSRVHSPILPYFSSFPHFLTPTSSTLAWCLTLDTCL